MYRSHGRVGNPVIVTQGLDEVTVVLRAELLLAADLQRKKRDTETDLVGEEVHRAGIGYQSHTAATVRFTVTTCVLPPALP